ncbi:alpha-D-ribose 1-methylphosphonate 5-triphosphate diphosphatase [Gottschalkia purinilytica]|nr:alpha-D-ribose 1-methylphosphonate 5-triphosphate diphosphatase [Gottschalkia purinilytica]
MENKIISNGLIIGEKEVFRGFIRIESGLIKEIGEGQPKIKDREIVIDAMGNYVMPGIIDIHSDAIEREIEPRPNTLFPFDMAFYEMEKKLVSCGITTIYHSLSYGQGVGVRDCNNVLNMLYEIDENRKKRTMLNHKIHLRYEILYLDGLEKVKELLDQNIVNYISFMNHIPGQGQFTKDKGYIDYAKKLWGFNDKDIQDLLEYVENLNKNMDKEKIKKLVKYAKEKGLNCASHDDDTVAKIDENLEWGISVSEFPITLEAAQYATEKGMLVCVGGPNIIRGKSHSNNMRAIDAIKSKSAHIVCSDYYPPSLLFSIFKMEEEGISLNESVNMVTLNPAKAVSIDKDYGSIKEGKKADILIVEKYNGYPIVRKTIVNGNIVYEGNYIENY